MKRLLVCLFGTALLAACGQGAEAPAEGIKELMANRVQPTAKLYWDSVQYISDENGSREIVPTNDAEWARTRKAAEDLAAMGELLMTPAYADGRAEDWKQFSQGLIDISKRAALAADHKSPEEVFEVGGTVYSVCSACHQAYPATAPEPGTSPSGAAA